MRKLLLLGFVATLSLASCSRDDDDDYVVTPPPAQEETYLTTGTWRLTAAESRFSFMGVDSTVNAFDQMPECVTDNTIKVNTDGTTLTDEGATKCSESDPQTTSGTWDLLDNETKLSITSNPLNGTFDVLELSATTLRVSLETSLFGATTTTTFTLKH